MRSKYKLGDIISLVDKRNTNFECTNLKGLSMTKEFRPSTSNIVGTDLSKYKIVEYNQFAVDFMSTIRVHRMPIALNKLRENIIISPAYAVFEVKDESVILTDYLMMWFLRPEFDRYADFRCDAAIRGGYGWNELCDTDIEIPEIEEQKKRVFEYKTITDRIALKQRINDNLEASIEAMFCNYYSDISEDNCILLQELCELTSSKRVFADDYKDNGIPFYRGSEITLKHLGKPIISPLYISCEQYNALRKEYGVPQNGDILITAVGTIGNSYMVQNEDFYFKDGNIIWLRNFSKPNINYYIYDFMKSTVFKKILDGICIGSTQTALTIVSLSNVNVKIPDNEKLSYYTKRSKQIHLKINDNIKEIEQLQKTLTLLLSVLSQ